MKTTTLALVAALLVIPVAAAAQAGGHADHARKGAAEDAPKDLVRTAADAGSFTTLLAAAEAAGLVDALSGDGPLTVFAPTDDAFAALPDGTVGTLLEPENRDALRRILLFHVVPGRVMSSDLLPAGTAETLAGDSVPFGLRVGDANVTQADIQCSNGVIHVIDAVLLPPARSGDDHTGAEEANKAIEAAVIDAIERGVPLHNDGDPEACARVYRDAVRQLLREEALAELHRSLLVAALAAPAEDASEEAWNIRRAFDFMLADISFEPRIEAPIPEGFPAPGPVARVVKKEYPAYRAARAEGGRAFWTLFEHIQSNDIPMTAPVEMTLDDQSRERDMAFLYESTRQGEAGAEGAVEVLDLEPVTVLSIGVRGPRDAAATARARKAIEERLIADGLSAAGPWRTLGYNSPMVPAAQRYWELQVPIE